MTPNAAAATRGASNGLSEAAADQTPWVGSVFLTFDTISPSLPASFVSNCPPTSPPPARPPISGALELRMFSLVLFRRRAKRDRSWSPIKIAPYFSQQFPGLGVCLPPGPTVKIASSQEDSLEPLSTHSGEIIIIISPRTGDAISVPAWGLCSTAEGRRERERETRVGL